MMHRKSNLSYTLRLGYIYTIMETELLYEPFRPAGPQVNTCHHYSLYSLPALPPCRSSGQYLSSFLSLLSTCPSALPVLRSIPVIITLSTLYLPFRPAGPQVITCHHYSLYSLPALPPCRSSGQYLSSLLSLLSTCPSALPALRSIPVIITLSTLYLSFRPAGPQVNTCHHAFLYSLHALPSCRSSGQYLLSCPFFHLFLCNILPLLLI
jgi:hypothetical protein